MMFDSEPRLIPHADGIHWSVGNIFAIHDPVLGTFHVPAGFITDLGSIPKIFQSIISPEGRPLRAYLGHDFLYVTQQVSRYESDACLMRMMVDLHVKWLERFVIYAAVRLFGWYAWNKDKRRRLK